MGGSFPNTRLAVERNSSSSSWPLRSGIHLTSSFALKSLFSLNDKLKKGKKDEEVEVAVTDEEVDDNTYNVLLKTPAGQRYDDPEFVTDPGIERYMSSKMVMQMDNQRVELRRGDPRGRILGFAPRPPALPTVSPSDEEYEKLSSSPSKYSFEKGDEGKFSTPERKRLSLDSYHKFASNIVTRSATNISELYSSDGSSIDTAEVQAILDSQPVSDLRVFGLLASPPEGIEAIDPINSHSTDIEALELLNSLTEDFEDVEELDPKSARRYSADTGNTADMPRRRGPIINGEDFSYLSDESIRWADEVIEFIYSQLPPGAKIGQVIINSNDGTPSATNNIIQQMTTAHPEMKDELEALEKSLSEYNRHHHQGSGIPIKSFEHHFRK